MREDGRMTNTKCPNCGSRSLKIEEVYKVTYTYATAAGYVQLVDRKVRIYATIRCIDCDHKWRPNTLVFEVDRNNLKEI